MSQPKYPRNFKFVGGPSRKRRRANPSAGNAESPSTNNVQKMMQPVFAVQLGATANSNSESNDGYSGPGHAARNLNAATVTRPSETSIADEPPVPPAAVIQDWSTSIGQQMASDALEAALLYNDPFSLSGARFQLASPSGLGLDSGAAFDISLDTLEDCASGDHGPLVTDDLLWDGSSNSTEDILRESGPELEGHVSTSGDISDTLYGLFTQCKIALTLDAQGELDAQITKVAGR